MPCSPGVMPVPSEVSAIGVVVGKTEVIVRLPGSAASEVRKGAYVAWSARRRRPEPVDEQHADPRRLVEPPTGARVRRVGGAAGRTCAPAVEHAERAQHSGQHVGERPAAVVGQPKGTRGHRRSSVSFGGLVNARSRATAQRRSRAPG